MSTQKIIGLIIFVSAFYLVAMSLLDGGAYFLTVDEVQAAEEKGFIRAKAKLRIKGNVAHKSYKNEEGSSEHRFDVEGKETKHKVSVYFKGAIPDVFKEGAEVVATGSFDENHTFIATEVTAKCPSKYEKENISPEARKRNGMDAPQEMK